MPSEIVGVVGIDEVSAHCSLPVVQVNLANNQLCGINLLGVGTYNADGIKAIAKAISVTPSLTSINLRLNFMRDDGEALLRKAVEGRAGFELLL